MAGNLEQLLADVLAVYLPPGEPAPTVDDPDPVPPSGIVATPPVGPDDEEMIAAVMLLLRRVAAASKRNSVLPAPPKIVGGVLSGSELIMRWECLAGRSGEVPGLLPGFTYMASVFYLDLKLALRKSDQVRALVEAAGYETRDA